MMGRLVTTEDKRLIAGRVAGFAAIVDAVALPMVAASRTTPLHVWLAVAVIGTLLAACLTGGYLFYVRSPRREGSPTSAFLIVQIMGGPCDGKRITLPGRQAVPSQLFVRHPGFHCVRRSRYTRVVTTDAALRFRYDEMA